MKTGPIDPQIIEQLKELRETIERLTKNNEALTEKLKPILYGIIPSSSSSISSEYVDKLCPLAKDLFYCTRSIQDVVSSLHITTARIQI